MEEAPLEALLQRMMRGYASFNPKTENGFNRRLHGYSRLRLSRESEIGTGQISEDKRIGPFRGSGG